MIKKKLSPRPHVICRNTHLFRATNCYPFTYVQIWKTASCRLSVTVQFHPSSTRTVTRLRANSVKLDYPPPKEKLKKVGRCCYIATSPSIHVKRNSVALSASELSRPIDRRLSATLVPTFADRRCVTDPYGRILGFLDRSRYFFYQVAPQLYSRG
jgi:hypothetical protein